MVNGEKPSLYCIFPDPNKANVKGIYGTPGVFGTLTRDVMLTNCSFCRCGNGGVVVTGFLRVIYLLGIPATVFTDEMIRLLLYNNPAGLG